MDRSQLLTAKLLTAIEHIATGAENAASTAPSGSPHAMGFFAAAKNLINELRAEMIPPAPDPADTSADAMNAGEVTVHDPLNPVVGAPDEQHPS